MRHPSVAIGTKVTIMAATVILLASGSLRGQARESRSTFQVQASPQGQPAGASADSGLSLSKDSLSTTVTGARVLLGPGDLLEISVFDTPELTQRVRVNSEGKITLTLLGEIDVQGISPEALGKLVTTKLIDGHFVKAPHVSVFVAEYAGQMAYINGEVVRPGAYPLLRAHRLIDLISVAGGLNSRAGNDVTIVRSGDSAQTIHVDLSGIDFNSVGSSGSNSKVQTMAQDKETAQDEEKVREKAQEKSQDEDRTNPEIMPGDSITVGQAGIVYVLGDVGLPGGFVLDRRATLSVVQAVALAEGAKPSASLSKSRLIRINQGQRQDIPLDLKKILQSKKEDIPLQTGDIIFVPGSLTHGMGRLTIQTMLATAGGAAIYAAHP